MDAKELTDDALMSAIKSVCDFDTDRAEKWRPEALAIGRAVERAVRAHTPQPTTQFEAWAKLHHYDLVRCSHESYAAYRSDLTNAALAGWRGANGEMPAQADHSQCCDTPAYCSSVRRCTAKDAQPDESAAFEWPLLPAFPPAMWTVGKTGFFTEHQMQGYANAYGELVRAATAPQADHYQQLLGVAYVVLGCLAANGVDIPVRFLDAFADPDSVENPLELLPCDFSPAQAVRAAVEAALTDEQIEQLWERVTGFRANDERAAIAGFARAILGASQ